jgi:hypothetical protein
MLKLDNYKDIFVINLIILIYQIIIKKINNKMLTKPHAKRNHHLKVIPIADLFKFFDSLYIFLLSTI